MPNLREISDAIVDRLREADEEIASLRAARAALTAAPVRSTGRASGSPRTRRAPRRPPAPTKPERAQVAAPAATPPEPPRSKPAAPKPPAPKPPASESAAATPEPAAPKRRRRSQELAPGQLEDLLRAAGDGLSLVALASRAEVSEAKVRDRLRALERSGEVRNTGARRTSLWRWIPDEERIAERAAELARRSGSPADD